MLPVFERFRRSGRNKNERFPIKGEITIDHPADVIAALYQLDAEEFRICLPGRLLRTRNALRLDENHPFPVALQLGRDRLRAFYDRYAPADLADMYFLERHGRAGEELSPWIMPWSAKRTTLPREHGLGPDHGVQFYGPVTDSKLDLEWKRLNDVWSSIQKVGYQPDQHGDIEGQFMRDECGVAFRIMGGNHRAAALVALGWSHIPVRMRRSRLSLIDGRDAGEWPLVRSGEMQAEVAHAIFRRYMEGWSFYSGSKAEGVD